LKGSFLVDKPLAALVPAMLTLAMAAAVAVPGVVGAVAVPGVVAIPSRTPVDIMTGTIAMIGGSWYGRMPLRTGFVTHFLLSSFLISRFSSAQPF